MISVVEIFLPLDTRTGRPIDLEVIEGIAKGLADFSSDVDALGDAYEYLIGQFAGGSGKKDRSPETKRGPLLHKKLPADITWYSDLCPVLQGDLRLYLKHPPGKDLNREARLCAISAALWVWEGQVQLIGHGDDLLATSITLAL